MNHESDSKTGNSGSNDGNDDRKRGRREREGGRRGRGWGHGRRHGQRAHGFSAWAHRKERVLHTRVSEDLHDALHRAADELRLPVSNFVRNAIEDVLRVVDGVNESVGDMFGTWVRDARDRKAEAEAEESRPRPDFSDVTGWQPILVHRPGPCADCGIALVRGDEGYLGVSASGAPPTLVCRDCVDDD
jgi:hypothetical protein